MNSAKETLLPTEFLSERVGELQLLTLAIFYIEFIIAIFCILFMTELMMKDEYPLLMTFTIVEVFIWEGYMHCHYRANIKKTNNHLRMLAQISMLKNLSIYRLINICLIIGVCICWIYIELS